MENIHPIFDQLLSREEQEKLLNQKSKVFWFTGLSGSGKSTLAKGVEKELHKCGFCVKVLDGDNVRSGICNNLDFTLAGRQENIRRIAEVAKLFIDTGIIVICSFVSPTTAVRNTAKQIIGEDDFYEVFIDTPLEICEQRDVKGLYKKARAGLIQDFTGISSPFEEPIKPKLRIKTKNRSIEESTDEILQKLLTFI